MGQCGYFMRLKNADNQLKPVKIPALNNNFHISFSDEDITVKHFVEALYKKRKDDAKVYISKNLAGELDLDELSDVFNKSKCYKSLAKVEFTERPKNCKTNSILILQNSSIIHLHLIKEPDAFSKWKIYGIDKE